MRMLLLSGAGALQIGHASFACPPLSTPLRSAKPSFPPPRLVVAASILAAISLAVCFLGFAFPVMLFFFLFFLAHHHLQAAAAAQQQQYRKYVDRLDGYEFNYPAGWIQVRGAGADVFFRDPVNLDENVLVEISSPSSSKFKGVQDLGSPEQAGKKVLRQYLTEFMSTRLGVRRESNIVATGSRLGDDGRLYYDVEVNVSSYANNNQLAVMPQDRVAQLEWSRRYLSVLGVENSRLYELRLQVPEGAMEREEKDLRGIMDSFRVLKLEA
ncbi:unnamed protein product [Sphagnum jensenii]